MKVRFLCLFAVLLTGCFSGTVGPFRGLARMEGVGKDIPPESIAEIRKNLTGLASQRERAASDAVTFWESTQSKYSNFLIAPRDPEIQMQQINQLVENYRAYPYKTALAIELREQEWPYGLADWRTAMYQDAAAGLTAAPVGAQRSKAAQASPLWVERFVEPPAVPSREDSEAIAAWLRDYLNRLDGIHTFWLSVNLAMEMQAHYIRRIVPDQTERFRDERIAQRSTYRLPLVAGNIIRLEKLDAVFGNFPGYQRERKRFQPVEGANAWQLPREHLYGEYNVWTILLYTSAEGYQWLSEGVYQRGEDKIAATRVHLQQGFAYTILTPLWLPGLLLAKGSSERQSTVGTRTEQEEKTGGLLAVWPFYIYGDGTFFLVNEEKARIFAAGVPLAYAFGKIESEEGRKLRMHAVLNGNIYAGGVLIKTDPEEKIRFHSVGPFACLWISSYSNRPRQGYAHLIGAWGALWTSVQNKGELAERHGPLFGLFGWGKNKRGEQVVRLFGIPFRTGK